MIEKGTIRPAEDVTADLTRDCSGLQSLPHRGDKVFSGDPVTKKRGVDFFITFEDIVKNIRKKFSVTIVPNPEKTKPPDERST